MSKAKFPGIGFRDAIGEREAYVLGHRVAVWEVAEVYHEARNIAKTAAHFGWTPALVNCALAYAKSFPKQIEKRRQLELKHQTTSTDEILSPAARRNNHGR